MNYRASESRDLKRLHEKNKNKKNFSGVSGEASERHEVFELEGSKLKAQKLKGSKADEFQYFGADVVLEVTIVRFFSCA